MGARVVAAALGWVGTPYHHQASRKGVGCDCLGLVRGVWRELFGDEPETPPPYSRDWAEAGAEDTLLTAARRHLRPVPVSALSPGDVIVFRYRQGALAKHAAIYLGEDRFLHAMEGAGVVTAALTPWWRRRIAGVFRFPE